MAAQALCHNACASWTCSLVSLFRSLEMTEEIQAGLLLSVLDVSFLRKPARAWGRYELDRVRAVESGDKTIFWETALLLEENGLGVFLFARRAPETAHLRYANFDVVGKVRSGSRR